MPRHFNVDLSVTESDDEEDVKRPDRRDAEKVASPYIRCMTRQELPRRSGRALAVALSYIFGHGPRHPEILSQKRAR